MEAVDLGIGRGGVRVGSWGDWTEEDPAWQEYQGLKKQDGREEACREAYILYVVGFLQDGAGRGGSSSWNK